MYSNSGDDLLDEGAGVVTEMMIIVAEAMTMMTMMPETVSAARDDDVGWGSLKNSGYG